MPAINWTAEDLAALSAVSSMEYQELLVAWQRYAPRNARQALVNANNGQPVSRDDLDKFLAAVALVIAGLSVGVQNKDVHLEDWQLQMADFVRLVHLAGAAAAVGGVNALTVGDVVEVEEKRRFHLEKLLALVVGLSAGKILLDGRFVRRSQMYVDAGRGTFYDVAQNSMSRQGFDRIRSIRSARDSCQQCIRLDGVEFAIGDPDYVKPGQRICLSNCLCYEEYINSVTGETMIV